MRTVKARSADRRNKPSPSLNPMGLLTMMSLFMFTITGAFWIANDTGFTINSALFGKGRQSALSDEQLGALNARHVNRKFVMGGVYLGMSQQDVLATHPDAQLGVDRTGEPTLFIPTPNGVMVAWLYSNDNYVELGGDIVHDTTLRVYRLRLEEGYTTLSEQDILSRYTREYGRPIDANCNRAGLGDTPRCTYQWLGGDGIALQTSAKKKTDPSGRSYTQLTTTATNTIKTQGVSVVRLSDVSFDRRID